MKKLLLIITLICLIPSVCTATWNAYITEARTKYRPNDTIPTTTSLTVNTIKGQFACWQILCKIDGEDVTTINATATTPAKGGDSLTVPLIYKEYFHNIIVPSRQNNLGGLGTNLGNPIGEIPDALVPKIDAYYSDTRNAFPFNINRISPVYIFPKIKISGFASSSVVSNNTASTVPTIAGTYSGAGLNNYHIVIDGAGAKGVATFKWSTSSFNIKTISWPLSTKIATVTTYQPHGFSAGDTIRIKSSSSTLDGDMTVLATPAPTTYTFAYSKTDVGTSDIYYSLGGGTAIKTWGGSGVLTGDTVALSNGLTITFPVQTYAIGDEWEFYVNTSRVETIWMESYIPTDAVAGTYTSTITVTANGKSNTTLNLTIVVNNLAIGKEPTVPIDYIASPDNPVRGHFNTLWFDPTNSTHTSLVKRYIESGLRHRMTLGSIMHANYTWNTDGSQLTNWVSVLQPWYAPYMNGTWTQGVEPTGIKPSHFRFGAPPYMVVGSSVDSDLDYTTIEKSRITTFAGLMDAEGWMTTFKPTIAVAEEPTTYTGNAQTAIQNAYNSMKAINTNYRALAHKRYVSNWVGYIDVWDSNQLSFGTYPRSTYDTEITNGNELWSYTGCDNKGCGITGNSAYDSYSTFNVDSSMTDIIGYHWLKYDNDVRGDFYYNALDGISYYNYYPGMAQQDMWDITLVYGGNGEGTFWYPGRPSGDHAIGGTYDIPIESLRLKAYRMGQEDYELFKLSNRSSLVLTNIENAVGTKKWYFDTGVNPPSATTMETARNNIITTLIGSPPPAVIPTVSTTDASSITPISASSGGNVVENGGGTVSARGVCWSTTIDPTTSSSHTTDGAGTGVFTSSLTGLLQRTTYYVRAYATNEAGTAYGGNVVFTTVSPFVTIGAGSNTISIGAGSQTLSW